jgi:hypothetical protein
MADRCDARRLRCDRARAAGQPPGRQRG